MSSHRSWIPFAIALVLTLAVAAVPDSAGAAACRPGTFAHIPPECAAPGGAPGRALERPSAGAFRGSEAGFHFGADVCERVARWAPVHRQERHGIAFDYYWVWVRDGNAPSAMALVCGARAGYSNVSGGFGHNRDGFWNYRFYNPHAGAVQARLYGACRLPPPCYS